jgi:regulator of protease activity HflC (stomatin/prohibitin superfamily)
MELTALVVILVVAVVLLGTLTSMIRVVREYQRLVVFRWDAASATAAPA